MHNDSDMNLQNLSKMIRALKETGYTDFDNITNELKQKTGG